MIELHVKCNTNLLICRRELHQIHYYTTQQGLTMNAGRNTRPTGAPVLKQTISTNKIHERNVFVIARQAWITQPPPVRVIKKLETIAKNKK